MLRLELVLVWAGRHGCSVERVAPAQVAGLMAVLDLRGAAAASQAARTERTEQAARPAALHVLCLLCCGGAPIARRLLAEGACA